MYTYSQAAVFYLLGQREGRQFPLVKVRADSRGIKVFGLLPEYSGSYAHVERYAEDDTGKPDKSRSHMHFRDTRAPKNWKDEVYESLGARAGIRGGCVDLPCLDILGGYLRIAGFRFRVSEAMDNPIKPKYTKNFLAIEVDDYLNEYLTVEVWLLGNGSTLYMKNYEPASEFASRVYDEGEPKIVFTIPKSAPVAQFG